MNIDDINKPRDTETSSEYDGSTKLKSSRQEREAQLHAQGVPLKDALIRLAHNGILPKSAGKRASELANNPDFMARVDFVRNESVLPTKVGKGPAGKKIMDCPDLDDVEGVLSILKAMLERWCATGEQTNNAISAAMKLVEIKGFKEAMLEELTRLDPAQVCAWLTRAELDGLTPIQALLQHSTLKQVASAAFRGMEVDGVIIFHEGAIACAGENPTDVRPTSANRRNKPMIPAQTGASVPDTVSETVMVPPPIFPDSAGMVADVRQSILQHPHNPDTPPAQMAEGAGGPSVRDPSIDCGTVNSPSDGFEPTRPERYPDLTKEYYGDANDKTNDVQDDEGEKVKTDQDSETAGNEVDGLTDGTQGFTDYDTADTVDEIKRIMNPNEEEQHE